MKRTQLYLSLLLLGVPQLKPATTGDIIDYYGPCDHEPLGQVEIAQQKELQAERKASD